MAAWAHEIERKSFFWQEYNCSRQQKVPIPVVVFSAADSKFGLFRQKQCNCCALWILYSSWHSAVGSLL